MVYCIEWLFYAIKENENSMRYCSVNQVADIYAGTFSRASLRWLIFNEKTNGFSCCIRRVGRKILINLDEFEKWIESKK
jgi:hypothetical protein